MDFIYEQTNRVDLQEHTMGFNTIHQYTIYETFFLLPYLPTSVSLIQCAWFVYIMGNRSNLNRTTKKKERKMPENGTLIALNKRR